MNKRSCYYLVLLLIVTGACRKDALPPAAPPPATSPQLSYGDSVFYVAEGQEDQIITPSSPGQGKYSGFPEGIELDPATGAINVNKSETGLRYRISFISNDTHDTLSTIILLSGINYQDNIYSLERNDTLAPPIYNGRLNNPVPGADGSSVFDEDGGCKSQGIEINPVNGTIDLGSVIRNEVLGKDPANGVHKEVDLLYRINDGSKKALNKVRVKFYYFDSPQDITEDLIQLMNDRQGMFIGIPSLPPFYQTGRPEAPSLASPQNLVLVSPQARPRPPCIFIVRRS